MHRVTAPNTRTAVAGGLLMAALLLALPARAAGPVNKSLFGTAVEGVDVVAYFTDGKAVKGSKDHTYEWKGATWRFASAEHRDRFAANPEAYAPRYGGYCAYAVSQGTTAGIDPEAWKIVDGKLYLNLNPEIQRRWLEDVPGYIAKADAHWPGISGEAHQMASHHEGAANPCAANPCAKKPANPCAANPCAGNPCAGKPANPCAANPCGGKPANPCAANPCGGKPANPCGQG